MGTASRPPETEGFTPPAPAVPLANCPIATSLGTLGRKWTLVILRDIAFYSGTTFSFILKSNRGLRQRTLSLRLRQLVAEGLIDKQIPSNGGRRALYALTPRGREVWPVLAALFQYGVRLHAEQVFTDGKARNIEEVFPTSAGLMLGHLGAYARANGAQQAKAAAGPPESRRRASRASPAAES